MAILHFYTEQKILLSIFSVFFDIILIVNMLIATKSMKLSIESGICWRSFIRLAKKVVFVSTIHVCYGTISDIQMAFIVYSFRDSVDTNHSCILQKIS